jgi:alkylation response protein AidB-like acyl-CoA dehydrogenase
MTTMQRLIYDDDHLAFREAVKGFIAQQITPNGDRFREEHGLDRAFWKAAGELDLLGISVPAEYGGSEIDDFRFNMIVNEELSREGAAYGSCVGIHADICAPYLIDLTTDEQKARWLPGFCTGDLLAAIGMTEPEVGSDLANLRTSAVLDGDEWVINGGKTFITNGGSADLIITAVRTDGPGAKGISMIVVPADAPGFERGGKLAKIGQHESDTAELFFNDCRVPASNLLGERGAGFVYMMERLEQERLSCAIANVGHAWGAYEHTLQYVQDRRAFGQPIGRFQNSQFKLAEMATELDALQAYVDHCVMLHNADKLTAVDAAKVKLLSSEVQGRVIDICVQLHGGYGYMEEYFVGRAYNDARVTRIWAGSNEIMKLVIGRSLGIEA